MKRGALLLGLLAATAIASAQTPAMRVLLLPGPIESHDHVAFIDLSTRLPGETSSNRARDAVPTWRTHSDSETQTASDAFARAISGYDLRTPWMEALRNAFAQTAPGVIVEAGSAADGSNADYLITLTDEFVGVMTLDEDDAWHGVVTPSFRAGYVVRAASDGSVIARGTARTAGYSRLPSATATADGEAFMKQWPFLCAVNAAAIVDELLKTDKLHIMADRLGRGADLPPVAARLHALEARLRWSLVPARGWREYRLTPTSRSLEPRDARAKDVRIEYRVDFLIPELGREVDTVAAYLPIWLRSRLLAAPLYQPAGPFADIHAPGYDAYHFTGPGGEHQLVLFRRSGDALMRIVTISLVGKFEDAWPALRADVEQMLASSEVRL